MSLDNLQQTLDTVQDELSVEKLLDPEGVQCTIGWLLTLLSSSSVSLTVAAVFSLDPLFCFVLFSISLPPEALQ